VYSFVLGSPWQVIYTIEYSKLGGDQVRQQGRVPFWGTHDMGQASAVDGTQKPILATVTVTSSNQYCYGLWVGKSALMCQPDEMLTETLVQIGIRDPKSIQSLMAARPSFGSILYVDATEVAKNYAGPEWLRGPVQSNGFQWISEYTLFITTPNEPTIASRGVCGLTNMAGNMGCTDMNNLPATVEQVQSNARIHYLGLTSQPADADAPTRQATYDPMPDRFYLAGEYCATPNLQVPTMEKACESGKLCAQNIIADFGITSAAREAQFASGSLQMSSPSVMQNQFVAASTLVQVQGLQRTTDLVDYRTASFGQKAKIIMYTGFHLNFPKFVAPTVVILAIIVVAAIVVAIAVPLTRGRHRHRMVQRSQFQSRGSWQ